MGLLATLFGLKEDHAPDHSAALHRLEESLSAFPEAPYLACVGLLLAHVAHVDSEITKPEHDRIRDVLVNLMKLPAEGASLAADLAVDSALTHSIERYLVIRKLNDLASREKKLELVRALFEVACVEDITEEESDQIGAIATALVLPRSDFLAVRAEFSEHRAILKGLKR